MDLLRATHNKGGQVAATAAGLANARPCHQRYEKTES
jgi:hypothetical protein